MFFFEVVGYDMPISPGRGINYLVGVRAHRDTFG
jgi:hypothetical protein